MAQAFHAEVALNAAPPLWLQLPQLLLRTFQRGWQLLQQP
jgi:hypothetical protein